MQDSRRIAKAYLDANKDRHIDTLKEWVSFQSISTDPTCKSQMQLTAERVKTELEKCGIEQVKIMPTKGHPVIFGEHSNAGSDAPTLLIYGHYDVQPPEPLELWESPPFSAEIRHDYMFGRGVTDMKGQVLAALNAVEAILKTGSQPINFKFLIEGEEEIGSPNLGAFMVENKNLLACDFVLNSDTGILSPDLPTITYGLRGMAYFEVKVFGPDHDLHSGIFGGVVHNPAQALCEIIAGMHYPDGSVALPGFYDRVRIISKAERDDLAQLNLNERFYLEETGVNELWGEAGFSPNERTCIRPTLEVHGLYSGYIGEGGKTVLPSYAMAKISMRLVPDQDPDEVYQQLLKFFADNTPQTVRFEIKPLAGSRASITSRHSKGINALSAAMETIWGRKPVFKREGGSVPVVSFFQDILGVESVNTGFSMTNDNMHGPNERLHLPTWHKGTEALVHFYINLGQGKNHE